MARFDYFEKQKLIAQKIENIINLRELTKTYMCEKTGISKPTFDKFLEGSLTNKVYYTRYIKSIMDVLNLSDEDLFGKIKNEYIQMREIMEYQNESIDKVSEFTKIPCERLLEIEAGEDASIAELRDIAMALNTGVFYLLGKNTLDASISLFSYGKSVKDYPGIGGFWGHIGILLQGSNQYRWYPISKSVEWKIRKNLRNEWFLAPCMNNKLLVINSSSIKRLILLDNASDAPPAADWDDNVDCGETPFVIFEALEDYLFNSDSASLFSEKFREIMGAYLASEKMDIEQLYYISRESEIFYKDGTISPGFIDYSKDDDITDFVYNIYAYDAMAFDDSFLKYMDTNESYVFINKEQVAMLELPLVQMEEVLREYEDEMMADLEE